MQKSAKELVLVSLFRVLTPASQLMLLRHLDSLVNEQCQMADELDLQRRGLDARAVILAQRDEKFRAFLARLTA